LPLVIAEIGINHGGDIKVAKEMVRAAYKAGAECVKHQTHILDDEMTDEAKTIIPPNASISIWDIMENSCLTMDEEEELKKYTENLGLIYLSTPFSRKAANFLAELDVLAFKIGSGEVDNLPLLRHVARFGKPMIVSTGMQTLASLQKSVDLLREEQAEFVLLECTNLYPSPPENVSLQGIIELRNNFGVPVGFSDHSLGPTMAVAALGLGACVIERHFTDTRYREGPDISCSMDPLELSFLLDAARQVNVARRNQKSRTFEEEKVYAFARSSVVAEREMPAGYTIQEDDIWARRPGSGEISGHEFDKVVGRTLAFPVSYNQQLKWNDFL
jgi:sialic acid synthase SpsE